MFRIYAAFAFFGALLTGCTAWNQLQTTFERQQSRLEAIRDFLTLPPDCPSPCFISIRPGVSTEDELITILETHEWIGEYETDYYESWISIDWTWSGLQPAFIDDAVKGEVSLKDGIVYGIDFDTTIAFGDIWTLYGSPERACGFIGEDRSSAFSIDYPDHHFYFETPSCDPTMAQLMGAKLQIHYFNVTEPVPVHMYNPPLSWFLSCGDY